MSHEIYYTSAPEGLKRGTSGFCTVAASDAIPKPLWDRLETLSAYRHQFAQGSGAAGTGRNPVSAAHWILTVSGKTYHVLSRICDSGVDHTQRTNAFAHHLVLDGPEMEAALGGPAWMLEQPGVMADAWDGRVGSLTRDRLPKGDIFSPSRVCHAWAAATGDAGWGGHLADLFAKSPTRPVCILFEQGQDTLPLMQEAIALLPPAARWNVTFNTYFTSMPTSATCLWRCCLAGTPAAALGMRYAAAGLVLDLTDRAHLPPLPEGNYVTYARTGQLPEPPRAAKTLAMKSAPVETLKPKMPPVQRPMDPDDELDEAPRSVFDFADPPPPEESPGTYSIVMSPKDDAPEKRTLPSRQRGREASQPLFRRAEDALEEAERQAIAAAHRRRRQVLYLFFGALVALGVGTGLILVSMKNSAPPEQPPVITTRPQPRQTVPVIPETAVAVDPGPMVVPETQTQPTTVASMPATPVEVVRTAPAVVYPETLVLAAALERPNVATGIGERTQSLPIRSADLDPQKPAALWTAFPAAHREPATPLAASAAALYKNADLGTLSAQSETRGGKPVVSIRWKGIEDGAKDVEAVSLTLDASSRPAVEINWHAAILLKNPEMFSYAYWMLQNSEFEISTPRATRQRIQFKGYVPPSISLLETDADLKWPVDLPLPVQARAVETGLPEGWKAESYFDWTVKDVAARTPVNAMQVVKFKKPTPVSSADPWFTLTFGPGLHKVECNFARRLAADQAELTRYEGDFKTLTARAAEEKKANVAIGGTRASDKTLADLAQATTQLEAYKTAVAGYNDLTTLEIRFELPDGVNLATLHLEKRPKSGL